MKGFSRGAVFAILGISLSLYLLQVFTPLRLTSDGIAYLSLAKSAITMMDIARTDFPFPKGYPLFIFLLMRARLFSSATLVMANILFFLTALAFTFRTLVSQGFPRSHATMACLLTLLSFAVVKHITQGMSDFLFFALAAIALWSMTLSSWHKWLITLPCVVGAIEVRLIGLALIFPLAAIVWPLAKKRLLGRVCCSTAVVTIIVAGAWAGRHYFSANLHLLKSNGPGQFFWKNLIAHSQDFGELIGNAPLSKLPTWSHAFALFLGASAIVFFFVGTVVLRKRFQWCSSYMIGYSCLILPWPFTDPRFWIPAMPFALLTMYAGGMALLNKPKVGIAARRLVSAYCLIFCCLGLGALGYSTWLTFSGPKFPYRYGDGLLRTTYLTGCSAPTAGVSKPALELLKSYEWHCRDAR